MAINISAESKYIFIFYIIISEKILNIYHSWSLFFYLNSEYHRNIQRLTKEVTKYYRTKFW